MSGASEAKLEELVITEEDRKDKSKLNKKIDELDDKEYPVKERLDVVHAMVLILLTRSQYDEVGHYVE